MIQAMLDYYAAFDQQAWSDSRSLRLNCSVSVSGKFSMSLLDALVSLSKFGSTCSQAALPDLTLLRTRLGL